MSSAAPLNFVLDRSANYARVQESLLGTITTHLPAGSWTSSTGARRDGQLNFSLFVRQPADVVMSHGAADKNYFTDVRDDDGELFANRLSAVLVPGAWLRRKLLAVQDFALGPDQVVPVGWPRLDLLRRLPVPAPRPDGRLRVLWAPTHDFRKRGPEQRSTSSYPGFVPHLDELARHAEVAVSLHPRNRTDKAPTDEALVAADVVVSDFGTLVYEAWALGKPVVFPRWLLGDRIQEHTPGSAEAHIFDARIGYHPGSMAELLAVLADGPAVTPEVDAFAADYLDNYRHGSSGARTAACAGRLALRVCSMYSWPCSTVNSMSCMSR